MDSFFDVLFRSVISIMVLFFITELMGKKQISQLNMFDYIIGISIGSIAASLSVDDSIHYFDGILSIIIYVLYINKVWPARMASVIYSPSPGAR